MFISTKFQIILTIFMVFFALYPTPHKLVQSVYRVIDPPIDVEEVVNYPVDFSDGNKNPRELEQAVLQNTPYQYDWTTYGMPWYFPTVEEVIENQGGDCKSRMIILASMLEYLDEDYNIQYSLDHFWVEYPGKRDTPIESDDLAIYSHEDGFQLPNVQWDVTLNTYSVFWDYMPSHVKIAFSFSCILPSLLAKNYNDRIKYTKNNRF